MFAEIREIKPSPDGGRMIAYVGFFHDPEDPGASEGVECMEVTPEELTLLQKMLYRVRLIKPDVIQIPFNVLPFDVGIGLEKWMLEKNISEKMAQIKKVEQYTRDRKTEFDSWIGAEIH